VKRRILIEKIPGPFAGIYEKATRMVIKTYYREVAEEVTSSIRTGRILDLGTGPGYLPIEIAGRAADIKVDGIDLTRALIKMARENARNAGMADRVHFEVGHAGKLRFADESYDMVISTGMLHMLREPVEVLSECYRVLRPGGETWIYDPARVGSAIDAKKWKASFTFTERFVYLFFPLLQRINPPQTYSREEVIAMIGNTKFRDYSVKKKKREIRIKLRK
jgi:ubiquinone/menaquinone biosynthesis C-methylase UbiE